MKRILLFLTTASLVLALSVALAFFGMTTNLYASQFDLASPLLLVGAVLGSSLALLARSRRTTKQVAATRARRLKNP